LLMLLLLLLLLLLLRGFIQRFQDLLLLLGG
jgi:hypothetical protein